MLRGTIFDRSERALAMSVKVKSLYADPSEIEDVEATAEKTCRSFENFKKGNFRNISKKEREKNRRFVWLERKIDEDKVQEINENFRRRRELKKYDLPKIAGFHWKEEQKRKYPYGTLAAHIIGFSNADDIGQAGIEESKEGYSKRRNYQKLARPRPSGQSL